MKFRFLLFALFLITLSSYSSYHVFSAFESKDSLVPPPLPADTDTITLILPDQDYVISERDLDNLNGKLIIPTREKIVTNFRYNQTLGQLETDILPQDYVIDVSLLRKYIGNYLTRQNRTLKPSFTYQARDQSALSEYNTKLANIFSSPLTLILKDGSAQSELLIDPSIIRSVIVPTSSETNIPPEVDRAKFLSYILPRLTLKQKKFFNSEIAFQSTRRAIHSRFLGEEAPLVLGVDDGPSSKGELADKYLEVDLSQQKMYFFIDGGLYKEYRVSTGSEYPTPVGEFHILNKAPKAFSSIYNVWMPYWMGFKYAGDVGAYLGLHEIAYAVNDKGKPIYNHGYYIGDMMTGGCVAMEPKDSREIYNLSDVGMLVRIVK